MPGITDGPPGRRGRQRQTGGAEQGRRKSTARVTE